MNFKIIDENFDEETWDEKKHNNQSPLDDLVEDSARDM